MHLFLSFFLFSWVAFSNTKILPGYSYETVLGQLKEPVDLEFDPEGNLWVTGRKGHIWILPKGKSQVFLMEEKDDGLAKKLKLDTSGERGLHGIEFDPQYLKNGFVYIYYSVQNEDGEHFNRVSRWTVKNGIELTDEKIIIQDFRSEENGYHQGGAIEYNPVDKKLYISTGDNYDSRQTLFFYKNKEARTYNIKDLRGKILRVNLDGSVPKDNPFVNELGARGEIFTVGHRNPYTLAVHPLLGHVFTGEVGFDHYWNFEEINFLKAGKNYGWPRCQGRNLETAVRANSGKPDPCPLKNVEDPFLTYQHFNTPTAVIMGPFIHKTKENNLFYSALGDGFFYGDHNRQWIRFVKTDEKTSEVNKTYQIALGLLAKPLAMTLGPDGALYIVEYGGFFSDSKQDKVSRIRISQELKKNDTSNKEGSFEAWGWIEEGTKLNNSLDKEVRVQIIAKGEWKYAPHLPVHSADGYGPHASATKNFKLPGVTEGALVMKNKDGKFFLVGSSKEITIGPKQSVYFVMNDTHSPDDGGGGFNDNEGKLIIQWKVVD